MRHIFDRVDRDLEGNPVTLPLSTGIRFRKVLLSLAFCGAVWGVIQFL